MKSLGNFWASLCLALVMQGGRVLPFPRIQNLGPSEEQREHWYSVRASGEGSERVIEAMVYGEIGYWGITAEQFVRDLKELDDGVSRVVVSFATIGGDLMDGIAIHNALTDLGGRGAGRSVRACYSAGPVAGRGARRGTRGEAGVRLREH